MERVHLPPVRSWKRLKDTVSFPKHLPRDGLFHQNKAQRSEEQGENLERHHFLCWFLCSKAEGTQGISDRMLNPKGRVVLGTCLCL